MYAHLFQHVKEVYTYLFLHIPSSSTLAPVSLSHQCIGRSALSLGSLCFWYIPRNPVRYPLIWSYQSQGKPKNPKLKLCLNEKNKKKNVYRKKYLSKALFRVDS